MTTTDAWIQARIDATQATIEAAEAAAVSISTGAIEEYTLDTGQGIQRTRKANIQELYDAIDVLYNRHAMLCARLNGSNVVTVRPSFP